MWRTISHGSDDRKHVTAEAQTGVTGRRALPSKVDDFYDKKVNICTYFKRKLILFPRNAEHQAVLRNFARRTGAEDLRPTRDRAGKSHNKEVQQSGDVVSANKNLSPTSIAPLDLWQNHGSMTLKISY